MRIFQANKQEPYLSLILNEIKTVEGRLNKGKFKEMQVGDLVETAEERFEILEKNTYKTFREMILSEGIENVIPDKTTIDDAVNVYYRFYTKEQEREFGVVAIKIKKIKKN